MAIVIRRPTSHLVEEAPVITPEYAYDANEETSCNVNGGADALHTVYFKDFDFIGDETVGKTLTLYITAFTETTTDDIFSLGFFSVDTSSSTSYTTKLLDNEQVGSGLVTYSGTTPFPFDSSVDILSVYAEYDAIGINDGVSFLIHDIWVAVDDSVLNVTVNPTSLLLTSTINTPLVITNKATPSSLFIQNIINTPLVITNKVQAESLLLEIVQLNKYEVIYPNSLSTTIVALEHIVSVMPVIDGGFPKIPIILLEPMVNGQEIAYEFLESLSFDVLLLDAIVSGNNDPIIIQADVLNIDFFTPLPNYVGEIGSISVEPQVYAQSLLIPITTLYLKAKKNVYIDVDILDLDIQIQDINLWDRVLPTILHVPIAVTSSVAQPYKDRRVKSIGTVTFEKALYWSQNEIVNTYVGTSSKAIDGSTVASILPLKEFNKPYDIDTKETMFVNRTLVDALILEINQDSYDIIFNDGSFLTVKNNLLNNPLKLEPIFDGSDEYYIHMGVLV